MNITELRELLANAALCEDGRWEPVECPDDWWRVYVSSGLDRGDYVCECADEETARLIAAMHNALPELLDAAETLLALEWAEEWHWKKHRYEHSDDDLTGLRDPCNKCPMFGGYCTVLTDTEPACWNPWQYKDNWLAAYRERGENHADAK